MVRKTVEEAIKKLRAAWTGREVRDRMADTIEAMNEEVTNTSSKQSILEETFNNLIINEGNSNAEVVAARVDQNGNSYDTLGKRMNNFDSQLDTIESEKMDVNTTDISIYQINKNKGKIDQTYLTDELLSQIAGNAPIYAVPSNLSITEDKLASKYATIQLRKNLFNKKTITNGYYIDYRNGNEVSADGFFYSDYIRVKPLTVYTCVDLNQVAFYNKDKEFIGGDVSAPFTTPSEAYFLRFCGKTSGLDNQQLEENDTNTYYVDYKESINENHFTPENLEKINEELKEMNKNIYPILNIGKNLFDKNSVIKGKYIDASTGEIMTSEWFSYSDYIEVEEDTDYTIHSFNQLAFYNLDKKFIGGVTSITNDTFRTPMGTKYIRVVTAISKLDIQQVEKGIAKTSYESFKLKLDNKYIDSATSNIVSVGPNREFTKLRDAIQSITDNSISNPYIIQIDEGEYDLQAEYIEEISDSFIGPILGEGVSLIGTGSADKTILYWDFEDTTDVALCNKISTLNLKGEGTIENITVRGTNTRYAVHDDWSFPGQKHYAKNCKFYKYGSKGLPKAYGAGIWDKMTYIFEDCYFYTDSIREPYACHNNKNIYFTGPSLQRFINCTFESKGNFASLGFGSMGSGQEDKIELINCNLNGKIRFYDELGDGLKCDFKLDIIGCNSVPILLAHTNLNFDWSVNFITNEVQDMYNISTSIINKGTVVSIAQDESSIVPYNGVFSGVAIENIYPNEKGKIRMNGYLSNFESNNTFVTGQKIGIVDNSLITVSQNPIGVVLFDGFMKFI